MLTILWIVLFFQSIITYSMRTTPSCPFKMPVGLSATLNYNRSKI